MQISSLSSQELKIEFEISSNGIIRLLSKNIKLENLILEIPINTQQRNIEVTIPDNWGDEYGVEVSILLISKDLLLTDTFYHQRKVHPEGLVFT